MVGFSMFELSWQVWNLIVVSWICDVFAENPCWFVGGITCCTCTRTVHSNAAGNIDASAVAHANFVVALIAATFRCLHLRTYWMNQRHRHAWQMANSDSLIFTCAISEGACFIRNPNSGKRHLQQQLGQKSGAPRPQVFLQQCRLRHTFFWCLRGSTYVWPVALTWFPWACKEAFPTLSLTAVIFIHAVGLHVFHAPDKPIWLCCASQNLTHSSRPNWAICWLDTGGVCLHVLISSVVSCTYEHLFAEVLLGWHTLAHQA